MIVGKIIHLDVDDTNPSGTAPIIIINDKIDDDTVIPLTLTQNDDSVWLGRTQARELVQLLVEEFGE